MSTNQSHCGLVYVLMGLHRGTGVDRWGTGGTRPPTFHGAGDSIGIAPPPTFQFSAVQFSDVLSPAQSVGTLVTEEAQE